MIEAFRHYIHQKKLCNASEKILVAVSGGIDSVVMLDLFSKINYHFSIVHCNFSLRGDESDMDEHFVKELAEKYNVDFFIKKFNTIKDAEKNGLSIQETARNLRYDWFDELAKQQGFDHIAVAHHFDDQVETFFINLLRGSGVTGLKGMPVKRGKIIRPLLFARRSEIVQHATDYKLGFREDSSNSSDKYLRNRIRHNILPEIEELSNYFEIALTDSLEYLSEDDLLLKQIIQEKKNTIFIYKNNLLIIPMSKLKLLDNFDIWLYYLLKDLGFNRAVTDKIVALPEEKVGKIFYSESHQLLVDRDQLIIREKVNEMNHKRKWHLRKRSISIPLKLKPSVIENDADLKFRTESKFAYFDFEKLEFPLLIRHWREGDYFIPFGMKGKKLVSDFLIDLKVNRFEKENTFVMLSGDDIIWVIGLRSSEKFKVTKQTKKIYQVQLGDNDNSNR